MSSYVLVCTVVPVNGVCPEQNLQYEIYEPSDFILPTAAEFTAALPWILLMLMTAFGFKQIVKFIFNR
jgi:hypothetical protein